MRLEKHYQQMLETPSTRRSLACRRVNGVVDIDPAKSARFILIRVSIRIAAFPSRRLMYNLSVLYIIRVFNKLFMLETKTSNKEKGVKKIFPEQRT